MPHDSRAGTIYPAYYVCLSILCIHPGLFPPGHSSIATFCLASWSSQDILDASHWTQEVCRGAAHILLALQEKAATVV